MRRPKGGFSAAMRRRRNDGLVSSGNTFKDAVGVSGVLVRYRCWGGPHVGVRGLGCAHHRQRGSGYRLRNPALVKRRLENPFPPTINTTRVVAYGSTAQTYGSSTRRPGSRGTALDARGGSPEGGVWT